MRLFRGIIISGWLLFSFSACTHTQPPIAIPEYLELAEDNQIEIQKALDHYQSDPEPQKLQALEFLLEHMSGHSYVAVELYDSLDQVVPFCVTDFPDYKTMVAGMDSVEVNIGELHFDRSVTQKDLETITAEFLIENIDWSFRAWQELPWASNLTFSEFTNYVLPYRGSNEPIESFRPLFWHRYAQSLMDSAIGDDPVKAATLINQELKEWFRFDERYYRHPTDQGVQEMMEMKLGRCEDMTNLAISAMRANGIAVTSDYTPYWANSGNNHAWNAVLSKDKQIIPFMGCEADPGAYRLWNKLAKVYRKMYADQPENLTFQLEEWEKVPRWLSGKSYLDVTADYVDVSDVTLELDSIPDSTRFAYLCVFNSGEWSAIHWSKIKNNQVTFTDMGRDIAYLPVYFVNDDLIPASAPFILDLEGDLIILDASQGTPDQHIQLISTTKRKLAVSTDGIVETFFTEETEYEMFVWQDEWVSVGKAISKDSPLIFSVPENGLYWLVETDSRQQERIFTWENGEQVWW
ncbi:MAG: transglutaminase-like domain-containing protein [Candidatus Marinimicrobia bacterium]|nr:transglutaminase-like domain-containing protein [Candidatus Neomarinimicrobiota bacterium]